MAINKANQDSWRKILEESGLEQEAIEEVLASFREEPTGLPPAALKTENLAILRDQETDWRKRAVIAAEIIKQNL